MYMYAEFSRRGRVEVSVRVMREESVLFPRFPLCVLSPLEAIFSTFHLGVRKEVEEEEDGREKEEERAKEEELSLSILVSLLAFLTHSSAEYETDMVDSLLSRILWSMPPSSLPDWHLGPLLSGT